MTDSFTPRRAQNNYDRYPSPSIVDNDRYTPPSFENSNRKKPEIYHIGGKNYQKPIDDEPPFRSSSPPIKSSYPSTSNGPELYHLKAVENHDKIHDRHSPSVFSNNTRVSPIPLSNFSERKIEMYHLKTTNENVRRSPSITKSYEKTTFNDNNMNYNNYGQQKVTMYLLTSTDRENLPLSHAEQRSPSPPIPVSNRSEPAYNDRVDGLNIRHQYPPAALHTVSTNARSIPLSQSKASESIQRSMMKYRFNGY
ncbi:unnamed protein product [Rotaria sp. Silwood2]|nr:unnamed protein product [Rotaria sp. Silwood2]CAF2894191.1 unnamed protein product [Rotaria sp. Silwood2]CAF3312492.1 unnamed protein product [Rotaria sp. Silwood2]CAF4044904.1 unnamed protein product [Rotaria sp. Silwood2]CAF4068935.1 unnamed protein product [Rotaria sp. Silwood2]